MRLTALGWLRRTLFLLGENGAEGSGGDGDEPGVLGGWGCGDGGGEVVATLVYFGCLKDVYVCSEQIVDWRGLERVE